MIHGYHNIRTKPEHEKHFTFTCHMGRFNSRVMQQGDCNAPATMMRVMNYLFSDMLEKSVMIYLEDIIIGSDIIQQHMDDLRQVCRIMKAVGMWLNKKKCQIMPFILSILGHQFTKIA